MPRCKWLGIGLLGLMVVAGMPGLSAAQSGAFPQFSPDEEEVTPTPPPRAGRFPTGETSAETKTASQSTVSLPAKSTGFPQGDATAQQDSARALSLEELRELLQGLQVELTTQHRRHDFLYQADLDDQLLELFFSVQLSEDASQVRVRAWLDALPEKLPSEQPILGLLARNTDMQPGLHFGYHAETRRLLLETAVKNRGLTADSLKAALDAVSQEVAATWSLWSTAEWNGPINRVSSKPELDSRAIDFTSDQFELPVRR